MGVPDADRRGQWLRGLLDICVLALLETGESYGYELAQSFERAGLGVIQGGSLYPVLLRLQRSGLIEAIWRDGESGPARKYYRLTDAGRRDLGENRTAWFGFVDRIGTMLGKDGRA